MYSFKPLEEKDIQLLFEWQKQPHVSWWWQTETEWPEFENKYTEYISSDHVFPFIIQIKGQAIGYIQYYHVDKLDNESIFKSFRTPESVVGIDIFIGEPDYIASGHGTKCMRLFIEKIFQNPKIETVIVDPRAENLLAISCFSKIGFKPIYANKEDHADIVLMGLHKKDF
jgi:RimJ/RimL family protein N-acetyltransferase